MKTLNLEIFGENEDFYNDLDFFMCKRSKEYEKIKNRILSLNRILDKEESRDLKIDYFLGDYIEGTYQFQNLLGGSYDNREIESISLVGVSHIIESIKIDINFKYSAKIKILDTPCGIPLQQIHEDFLRLRPVYHVYSNQILTFNIDIINLKKAA